MAKKLFPSSFRCDCGHESHFFENTVREMENRSGKKKVRLGDSSGNEEHAIIFYKGKAIEVICPKLGNCKITSVE
jgi:hypothetical protein